jgi:maltose alpha-D-glucosyltransferase/alpha-amylase
VLSFLREYTDANGAVETVLCVSNVSRHPQPVQLPLSRRFHNSVPVELTGGTAFPNIGLRPYLLTLPGYGSYWFSIVPARQPVPRPRVAPSGALIGERRVLIIRKEAKSTGGSGRAAWQACV